jgi:hypothetical protein
MASSIVLEDRRCERCRDIGGLTSVKREFEEQWPTYLTLDVADPLCRASGELAERILVRL